MNAIGKLWEILTYLDCIDSASKELDTKLKNCGDGKLIHSGRTDLCLINNYVALIKRIIK